MLVSSPPVVRVAAVVPEFAFLTTPDPASEPISLSKSLSSTIASELTMKAELLENPVVEPAKRRESSVPTPSPTVVVPL